MIRCLRRCTWHLATCRDRGLATGHGLGHSSGLVDPRRRLKPSTEGSGCESTVQLLQHHGVDTRRVAETYPFVLRYDVQKADAAIRILTRHGIDAGKAVNRYPRVLGIATEDLESRIAALKELGIDVTKTIHSRPTVLNIPTTTIQKKLHLLSSLGISAQKFIQRDIVILICAEQAIRTRMGFLNENGLDAVRIVNAQPTVVGLDIDRKLRPTIEFITQVMGRSTEEISKCPSCFTYSLEKRLRPRYDYMKLYGKHTDYKLSMLCTTNDERFVCMTTSSLEHYRAWLTKRTQ